MRNEKTHECRHDESAGCQVERGITEEVKDAQALGKGSRLGEAHLSCKDRVSKAQPQPCGLRVPSRPTQELIDGGHERIGDAVTDAQAAYAARGALPEMLVIYHLFGDPAMMLR